jgi:hypothetical protein
MTYEEPFTPFACCARDGKCGGLVEMDVGASGKERWQKYADGHWMVVPQGFGIPTCGSCGETYLSAERGQALRDAWKALGLPRRFDWCF